MGKSISISHETSSKMDVFEVLRQVKAKNSITEMSFHSYPKQTLIQEENLLSPCETRQLNEALTFRDKYSLPFWDSLMLTFFDNKKTSSLFLKLSQRHNHSELFFATDISDIEKNVYNGQNNISVCSKVRIGEKEKHIPFIDFHIPPSEDNLSVVLECVKVLNISGYVLLSGESYHFIADQCYESEFIITFLAKVLFLSPIIDKSWVAHQLLERSCSLRVSKKHNIIPYVVGVV